MSKLKWMVGLTSAATLLASTSASATTLSQLKFDDMVGSAHLCVVAEAVGATQEKREGGVVTLTTFNVKETAFGSSAGTITVETAGGQSQMGLLQVSEVVAGSPRFFNGQDSMMLLTLNADTNDYSIVGFNQGVFSVDQATNSVRLPSQVGGAVSLDNALEIVREQRVNPNADVVSE